LCFPRSFVVARVHCERGNLRTGKLHEKWNCLRRQSFLLQSELARELTRNTEDTNPEERYGIREIERFQHLAVENIATMVYNFSIFERGENPLFDSCALLASLRREPSIRLNIMYYERRRHYNPILNVKVSADSRGGYYIACNMGLIKIEVTTAWKNAHAVTPFCRANPPTRAQLGAKRISYVL